MEKPPIAERVIAWVLCIMFLYLAGHGSLFFDNSRGNIASAGMYGDMVKTTASDDRGLEMLAAYFTLIMSVGLAFTQIRKICHVSSRNKILSALILLPLLSTLWSQNPHVTFVSAAYLAGNYLFAAYLAVRFTAEELFELFVLFGWLAVVLSISLAVCIPAIGVDQREGYGAWQGIFVHKNSAAVCIVFLITSQIASTNRSALGRILNVILLFLSVLLLILTQSRTGWIIFGAYLFFVGAMRTTRRIARRERALAGLVICCACIVMCVLAYLYSPLLLNVLGKDSSLTGRIPLWKAVSHMIGQRIFFGYGFQSFWNGLHGESADIQLTVGWAASHAQNGFLDILLGLGGVGFGLLILTMIQAVKNGFECLQNDAGRETEWYLAIVLITFACNLSERTIMYPHFLEWVMYMIACIGLARKAQTLRSMSRKHRAEVDLVAYPNRAKVSCL